MIWVLVFIIVVFGVVMFFSIEEDSLFVRGVVAGVYMLFALIFFSIFFWMLGAWDEPRPKSPSTTTTTTAPINYDNEDPTIGWVYDRQGSMQYRCEGPNMIFKDYDEGVTSSPDPRCAQEGAPR